MKLRPLLVSIAKEKGANFIDRDDKFDTDNDYDKDLINVYEMTPKELKKFKN